MSGQGYHFAISAEQAAHLLHCNDYMAISQMTDDLQELFREGKVGCGGYKEWDVLHRCLSDGTFNPKSGSPPLNYCFFGGRLLVTNSSIVNLVLPNEVAQVAGALATLDRAWLRKRFHEVFIQEYAGTIPETDVDWYWELLKELQGYYQSAAAKGQAVVFVTDDCLDYFWKPDPE